MSTLLLTLPFAGGNRYSLNVLKPVLPANVRLQPVELPGRDSRMNEPLLNNALELAEDVFSRIAPLLDQPYAIFGHCMGSLLGFLLTKKIIAQGKTPPVRLFVCGCSAPSRIYRNKLTANDLAESKKLLQSFGVHEELLKSETFFEMIEPMLYADIHAYNGYLYEKAAPVNVPITVIIEEDGYLSAEDAESWQEETTCAIQTVTLPGKLSLHTAELKEMFSLFQ